MPGLTQLTAFVLFVTAALGVYQGQDAPVLSFVSEGVILAGATNILLVYFLLALLIERACEVAVELATAARLVPPKDAAPAAATDRARRMIAALICLTLAVAVSLVGLRLVEMILDVATEVPPTPTALFRTADVVLTSLVLAGGSEGVHRIMSRLLGEKTALAAE